jgi:tripartite-type tricarboxylate transporter receptor subunit TctC
MASGQVQFGLVTAALALPHVREGRLRALAISAPKRWGELPDVPTVAEAGFADAMFLPWYGLAAPAATPRPIVQRLSDEILAALANPEVAARLDKMGTQVTPGSADAFDALFRSETERWSRVIRERNIRGES